jgi:hypothetical protein
VPYIESDNEDIKGSTDQRTDVTEPNTDVTGQSVGSRFYIEGGKGYSILDELIVSHGHVHANSNSS